MNSCLTVVALCCLSWMTVSKNGLDISSATSEAAFSCFAQQTATFVVIQAYMDHGAVNTNAPQNLKNAKNTGFSADIYMKSCPTKNATEQVS